MKAQEIKIAVVGLALIAGGALSIKFGKLRLGAPGLALEAGTLTNEVGEVVRKERIRFPTQIAEFKSADAPITKWEVDVLPKDTSFGRKIYWNEEGFGAQLTGVLMKSDRTSIHRPEICVTGQGWKIEKSEVIEIPIAAPKAYTLKATCMTLSKEVRDAKKVTHAAKGMYIYWFVSENRLASTHPEALWFISRDLVLTGTLHPWAYISYFSRSAPGGEDLMQARLKRLIAATTPEFQLTTGVAKETASLDSPKRLY